MNSVEKIFNHIERSSSDLSSLKDEIIRVKLSDSKDKDCSSSEIKSLRDELERLRFEIKERNGKSKDVSENSSLHEEINRLRCELKEKDDKIKDLELVINKLRSVLDQSNPLDLVRNFDNRSPTSPTPSLKMNFFKRSKKQGVSAEVWTGPKTNELTYYNKDGVTRTLIRNALMKNHLLKHLEAIQITEMIECMYEKKVAVGTNIIEEGSEANNLYVVQSGKFEVYKDKVKLSEISKETAFGELALLYNCKRTASVKAITEAVLWVINRSSFQSIMRKTCGQRHTELVSFLRSVTILKSLSDANMSKLADLLELQVYSKKECILREGEKATCFFIIQSGGAIVTQKVPNSDVEKDVRTLGPGDYFGEKALLSGGLRTANIYASENNTEILCLYRPGFIELIGDLTEIKNRNYGDEERFREYSKTPIAEMIEEVSRLSVPFADIQRIKTLGVGGFGRVYLVSVKSMENMSFALKCMKKSHIVKMKQQTHVLSEKNILSEVCCNFICRLYQTYRDNKYVYLLMEVCLGGELWSVLRDRAFFDENTTKFCLSCVIESFQYLHKRSIIYRDLKPENLLISSDGYLKLCDFGFAKKLNSGKRTWTFCGTPEYVAPEIILNKSHDASADLWSLGILTYELLNGMPPFTAPDPMKIYSMTLKGIESIDLGRNKRITTKAANFISQLCRKNPSERLGNSRNGYQDIRSHKFFQGFDWEKLQKLKMKSPFTPKVKDMFDGSNFDNYPDELEDVPEETSGWDVTF